MALNDPENNMVYFVFRAALPFAAGRFLSLWLRESSFSFTISFAAIRTGVLFEGYSYIREFKKPKSRRTG